MIDEFHQLSTRVVLLGPASDLRKCVGKLDLVKCFDLDQCSFFVIDCAMRRITCPEVGVTIP